MKPPKVRWGPEEGSPKIILNAIKGNLPEEYTCKYTTKGVPKRGTKGDILLACVENLQPENSVTMGIFTKMNNFANRKGPIPIFQVVHGNMGIPIVFKNFNTKTCSVLGISKLRGTTMDNGEGTSENDEYINPSLIKKN